MTPTETNRIMALAFAQWPHIKQSADLATVWQSHLNNKPLETVSHAVRDVLGQSDYPPTIAQVLRAVETLETGDDQWDTIAALLSSGAFGRRLNRADFPNNRSYTAARSVAHKLRTARPAEAEKIYRRAWKQTPADGTPALPATACTAEPDCPGGCLGHQRILVGETRRPVVCDGASR